MARKKKTVPSRPREKDPLSDRQAATLLPSRRVVRDPLHGDIRLTELERVLIDTPEFQRLRRVNQLAMVDIVYPGAVHNRFLHSLGTLHVCSIMITSCKNACKTHSQLSPAQPVQPLKIGPYAELLARLTALLHDLAHVPYGHVFEREAHVFKEDEWEDPWRVDQTLGETSAFADTVRTYFMNHFGSCEASLRLGSGDACSAANALLRDIRDVLTASKKYDASPSVLDLPYPFVFDIVGNTICADLIDYIQRDMFFCGLSEGLGLRFLQYIAVIPVSFDERSRQTADGFSLRPIRGMRMQDAPIRHAEGDEVHIGRLALLPYRNKGTKHNVIDEAIDMVRRRKQVSEKLFFHDAKLLATSMLGAAAHAAGINKASQIWDMSDYEVLKEIARGRKGVQEIDNDVILRGPQSPIERKQWRSKRAQSIGDKLIRRQLFRPLFRASYHPDQGDEIGTRIWHEETGAYTRYKDADKRETLIEKIERFAALILDDPTQAIGCCSISCPNKDMQLKGFDMLVLLRPDDTKLQPLQLSVQPTVSMEIKAIQDGHKELWRLEVFVDPAIVPLQSSVAKDLAAAIQCEIGLENEIGEFRGSPIQPIDELITRAQIDRDLRELGVREEITEIDYGELVREEVQARGTRESLIVWLERRGYCDGKQGSKDDAKSS